MKYFLIFIIGFLGLNSFVLQEASQSEKQEILSIAILVVVIVATVGVAQYLIKQNEDHEKD